MVAKSNEIVSAIIVTTGKSGMLGPCLDSLKAQTYPYLEVIVVDNSCDDTTGQDVVARYPAVHLCHNKENVFYGGALNIGIRQARGDFLLCLNDDVSLTPDFIRRALEGFSVHPQVGMVSGKILRPGGRVIDSTGLFLDYCRVARERGYGIPDRGQFEKAGFIFGVTGAAAFYRRKMLEEIKEKDYFDPSFLMFYEDLDISWRAQRKNWKAFYMPGAVAFHIRGASARSTNSGHTGFARDALNNELYAELLKNRYLAILKNESFLGFLLHFPGIFIYDLVAWGFCLLTRPQAAVIFLKKIKGLKII